MEERLLLDRIALYSSDISPRDVELSTTVEAHLADTGLTVWDWATVSAGVATHAIVIELLDQVGICLSNALIEDVAEGGHGVILSPYWRGEPSITVTETTHWSDTSPTNQ
jgi:hypothetical protein